MAYSYSIFIYSEGYPGIIDHMELDANTFAKWDVDYIKLDGCNVDVEKMDEGYPEFGRLLNATGRKIVYSCSWPAYQNAVRQFVIPPIQPKMSSEFFPSLFHSFSLSIQSPTMIRLKSIAIYGEMEVIFRIRTHHYAASLISLQKIN